MADFKIHKPDDELIIELKSKAEDPQKKKGNWLHRGRDECYYPRRRVPSPSCNWVRRWTVRFESYRYQSPTNDPIYRSFVETVNYGWENRYSGEDIGFNIDYRSESGVMNAGYWEFIYNRDTGNCTLSAPFGGFSRQAVIAGAGWRLDPNTLNGWVTGLFLFLRRINGFPSLSTGRFWGTRLPLWQPHYRTLIVERHGEIMTITGISMVQETTQIIDILTAPVPNPLGDCSPENATAQATAIKNSVAAQLAGYSYIQNVVWGEMQTQ